MREKLGMLSINNKITIQIQENWRKNASLFQQKSKNKGFFDKPNLFLKFK